MSSVQSQIQQDWNNREFVEVIASSIKKIAEFLNAFDLSARSRLAVLNQKLTRLERQVEYIEARVTKWRTIGNDSCFRANKYVVWTVCHGLHLVHFRMISLFVLVVDTGLCTALSQQEYTVQFSHIH